MPSIAGFKDIVDFHVQLRQKSWPRCADTNSGALFWIDQAEQAYQRLPLTRSWLGYIGWPLADRSRYSHDCALHDVIYLTTEVTHHYKRSIHDYQKVTMQNFEECSRILYTRAQLLRTRLHSAENTLDLLSADAHDRTSQAVLATHYPAEAYSLWSSFEKYGDLFLFHVMARLLRDSLKLSRKLHENAFREIEGQQARFEVWNSLAGLLQRWWDDEWEGMELVERDLDELDALGSVPVSDPFMADPDPLLFSEQLRDLFTTSPNVPVLTISDHTTY